MSNKLWAKNFEVNKEIERFTVGRDREMDLYLAKYDVLGSMAHITMLESIGLLSADELAVEPRGCQLLVCRHQANDRAGLQSIRLPHPDRQGGNAARRHDG